MNVDRIMARLVGPLLIAGTALLLLIWGMEPVA